MLITVNGVTVRLRVINAMMAIIWIIVAVVCRVGINVLNVKLSII